MAPRPTANDNHEPEVLYRWSARRLRPVIVLNVALVFAGFVVVALFVVHSTAAVKALVLAAVGALVPLVPEVLKRVEYRLTDRGIDRRPVRPKAPREFASLFKWEELSHVMPNRHGFRFFRPLNEPNPLRRLWKAHLSDAYSGEVHVETADQDRVMEALTRLGIPCR